MMGLYSTANHTKIVGFDTTSRKSPWTLNGVQLGFIMELSIDTAVEIPSLTEQFALNLCASTTSKVTDSNRFANDLIINNSIPAASANKAINYSMTRSSKEVRAYDVTGRVQCVFSAITCPGSSPPSISTANRLFSGSLGVSIGKTSGYDVLGYCHFNYDYDADNGIKDSGFTNSSSKSFTITSQEVIIAFQYKNSDPAGTIGSRISIFRKQA